MKVLDGVVVLIQTRWLWCDSTGLVVAGGLRCSGPPQRRPRCSFWTSEANLLSVKADRLCLCPIKGNPECLYELLVKPQVMKSPLLESKENGRVNCQVNDRYSIEREKKNHITIVLAQNVLFTHISHYQYQIKRNLEKELIKCKQLNPMQCVCDRVTQFEPDASDWHNLRRPAARKALLFLSMPVVTTAQMLVFLLPYLFISPFARVL